jgi:hypothetical protein
LRLVIDRGRLQCRAGPERCEGEGRQDLFIDIVLPCPSVSRQTVTNITTKSGEQIQGVKSEESARISSSRHRQPACRAAKFAKGSNSEAGHPKRSAMPAKYGEMYTVKQLLDIIAFLKGSGPGPAQV